jgi:hypothetical protein
VTTTRLVSISNSSASPEDGVSEPDRSVRSTRSVRPSRTTSRVPSPLTANALTGSAMTSSLRRTRSKRSSTGRSARSSVSASASPSTPDTGMRYQSRQSLPACIPL